MQHPATVIIVGRAGSKGLPGKNMLPVAGKPCAQWTIEHALASVHAGRVVVSTDDHELRSLARSHRVDVVDRPPELAHDTATVDAAARHSISVLSREHSDLRDPLHPVVVLYANVPVRPPDLTDRAFTRLIESNMDSVQSYMPAGKHHPWWTARLEAGTGCVAPWEGTVLNHGVFRRQDLPPAYVPDGGVMVMTRAALMLEIPGVMSGPHAFFGREDRRGGIVSGTRGDEVVDIDSRIDLLVAEALLGEEAARCRAVGGGQHAAGAAAS